MWNYFARSPIFVMKMASKARHLEVQLLADKYGEAIALSGRDCSVQRRHQKIIEEGPPTIAPPSIFKRMERAAVALAKTVGYCNAGTVEYLYLDESQTFAFLELNPRLQVEHPVTENILGLNLPACQLQVAMGIPLHRIQDVRKLYGRHPQGKDTIDFEYSERQAPPRHCIAVRVTAENPEAGFQPSSGRIEELHFHSAIDVWGYFSVNNSSRVHEFADSQFGHIFASGKDREGARRAMVVALKELKIRGDIRTTVEYIVKMLQSEDFIEGKFDTDWLDKRIARHAELALEDSVKYDAPATHVALCGAALQGYTHFEQRGLEFIDLLRVGQVPGKDTLTPSVNIDLIFLNVKYQTRCIQSGANSVVVECNGARTPITIRQLADNGYLIEVAGESHVAYLKPESGDSLRMILDNQTCIFTPEYDPTRLTSSVAGKFARQLVADGSHVNAGDPYVEIEVMKMYMPLKAPEAGTVHFQMSEGATLSSGDVIALMTLDFPDKVIKAERFTGVLTPAATSSAEESAAEEAAVLPHVAQRTALQQLEMALDGFLLSDADVNAAVDSYLASFDNKLLPVYEVEEIMSVLRGRVDAGMASQILDINSAYKASPTDSYPAEPVLQALHSSYLDLSADKRGAFLSQTSVIWSVVEPYLYKVEARKLAAIQKLVEKYISVERLFDNMGFTDVVTELRKDSANDLPKVLSLCRSHINLRTKNTLLLRLLDYLKASPISAVQTQRPQNSAGLPLRNEINVRNIKLLLKDLSTLKQSSYSHVSLVANLVLMRENTLRPETRRASLNDAVSAALTTGESVGQGDRLKHLKKFVDTNIVIRDLLLDALHHDRDYQIAVMELYLLKTYQSTHNLQNMASGHSLRSDGSDTSPWITFDFFTKSVVAVEAGGATSSSKASFSSRVSFNDLTELAGSAGASSFALAAAASGASSPTHKKQGSSDDLLRHGIVRGLRRGVFASVETISDLPRLFPIISAKIPTIVNTGPGYKHVNAIHIVITRRESEGSSKISGAESGRARTASSCTDDDLSAFLTELLSTQKDDLESRGIRRVTFFASTGSASSPLTSILTFRSGRGFSEDRLFRHIEAPHAFHLDLPRLRNFAVSLESYQTTSGNVFLYRAVPAGAPQGKGPAPHRYFARLVSFTTDVRSAETESLFVEALDHLSIVAGREETSGGAAGGARKAASAANHVFINIVAPDTVLQIEFFQSELQRICTKYWYKMVKLAITTVEVKLSCPLVSGGDPLAIRLVASNPTGFVLKIDKYFEADVNGEAVFKSLVGEGDLSTPGPWDGTNTQTPYEVSQPFEQKRALAQASSDTLYVYDWPTLFESEALGNWAAFMGASASGDEGGDVFSCRELVLCDPATKQPLAEGWSASSADGPGSVMLPIARPAGVNDVGMVAWLARIRTPECPSGRELVIIANDITFEAGSFGTREDTVFYKASEYARVRGLPRFFLAANSGARIGMAQSLKSKFQVSWTDENDPSKGFRYIYLTKGDYDALLAKVGSVEKLPVLCAPQAGPDGETRYVITDIIGEEPDLGVENLMGSGLIAGETSRAYDEIFTLTLVVGRTVGIGAYLVRLGQRTIQKTRNSPIILTGYQALNKLMGREIYTTNDQLGGPMIMFPNGVSHLLSQTHLESVSKALTWLAFVPPVRGAPLPIRDISSIDSIDRPVEFAPPKGVAYDPRLLLAGVKSGDYWETGFFDKDSFVEVLGGWAKTVVVGRGRLGGIPMGVIVTENRTSEATKPADPADATSREKMVQQAGGVWFPDSAYKTAQALRDFNREGLPCIIFANWRGFSGGQRDMFDEVLKFGSMIVDALVAYQQPLFVYIPPFAELRGGAWVVVDSTINADVMEFYAAEDARGGVLEAAGAASIKFRDRDVLLTAHRIDHVLQALDGKVAAAKAAGEGDAVLAELAKQIKQREKMLFGVFQQVAVHFADLHDTPGRMKAKGVIKKQVDWRQSRNFFFWRLRRRLTEFDLAHNIAKLKGNKTSMTQRREVATDLHSWYLSQGGAEETWDDDKAVMSWLEERKTQLVKFLSEKCADALSTRLADSLSEAVATVSGSDASGATLTDVLQKTLAALTPEERAQVLSAFAAVRQT